MCDVASVHDEIVRQRHNSRHCERLGDRHRTVYRGSRSGRSKVDCPTTDRNECRGCGQNLRGGFIM